MPPKDPELLELRKELEELYKNLKVIHINLLILCDLCDFVFI